jgi:Zinc carboxypeptidase
VRKTGLLLLVALASLHIGATVEAQSGRMDEGVRAADAEMFPAGVRYDSSVPTPESAIGHPLGRAPVRHHQLVDYLNEVAEASPRMSVEVIGYSHERRPILFLVVTSPANHQRLDELKAQHIALTEPGQSGRGDTPPSDMPVVTWLNYGVHGAESSGMDAALPIVYHLAAAQGPEIERTLDESIILITAVFNPDGHAKRIAWLDAYSSEVVNPDPQHIEHNFNWQFARTNHYWFDLNRQWLLVTQPEPRAWMKKWHEWRPNLTVDYHEMGSESTYYFHPGIESRTNPLVPERGRQLMAEVVRTSEDFLDSEARLYFHGESFDNYYIGKGSTFPFVNGGVGILYEAAAALGVEIDTANGLRTYRENIRKHFRTSLASIEGALKVRAELLQHQQDFYDSALAEADDAAVQAYVFDAPGDPARMYHFLDMLQYHRIRAWRLGREVTEGGITFSPGEAVVVPVNQPQFRLIRGMFETVSEFEDTTFYDVSTWNIPLAFDLDFAPLSGRRFNQNLLGEGVVPEMPVADTPDTAGYAYAFEWSGYYAPRALNRVLEEELLARVATKPFTGRTSRGQVPFARGTILVPYDRQENTRAEIREVVEAIAREDGITVHALESGASATGGESIDAGAPSFKPLKQPKVLLVVGRDMNLYDAGEIWHLLDHRMRMRVTLRDRDQLGGINWSGYTHIVFAGGVYDEYLPDFLPRLRQWVSEGGTLVALREAAHWARANVLDFIDPEEGVLGPEAGAPEAVPETPSGHDPEEADEVLEPYRFPYSEKETRDALELIGGAIFAGDLDNTHPIGFGYRDRNIALHKNLEDIMERPVNPFATVIAYDTPPVLSGYTSEANRIMLEGTAALIAERRQQGSIILFADNPNFRGYWYGTNKLFLNALFFSKAFDPLPED